MISNASARAGSATGLGAKRSTCRDFAGQARQCCFDRGQQRFGAAAVDQCVRRAGAQERRQIQQAGFVLRAHRDPVAVAGSSSRKAIDSRCRPP